MPRTITLSELRDGVRRRGDWENSTAITAVVLDDVLNSAIAEVWDVLVDRWADYYVSRSNLAATAGVETVALPSTFYKLRKVELLWSGTVDTPEARYVDVPPIDLKAAHLPHYGSRAYRYRIAGASLYLAPFPPQAETIRLWFIPYASKLVADGDTFDGVNGYEELVMAIAHRRLLVREELPTGEVDAEVARLTARVRSDADSRDAAEPFYLDPRGPRRDALDDDEEAWWL